MVKIGDKIKISNTTCIVVEIININTIKIIYKDQGKRILDYAILINECWQFESAGVSGRKLNNSEYPDIKI